MFRGIILSDSGSFEIVQFRSSLVSLEQRQTLLCPSIPIGVHLRNGMCIASLKILMAPNSPGGVEFSAGEVMILISVNGSSLYLLVQNGQIVPHITYFCHLDMSTTVLCSLFPSS